MTWLFERDSFDLDAILVSSRRKAHEYGEFKREMTIAGLRTNLGGVDWMIDFVGHSRVHCNSVERNKLHLLSPRGSARDQVFERDCARVRE
jgi:hypothetical protein